MNIDTDEDHDLLIAAIEDLDGLELAAVCGAFLLVPKNLHHNHRFQALANMVAAGRARGTGRVTAKVLKSVLKALDRWTGFLDDPWPNLAVEAFVYHGGTHLFIPGGIDTMFVLRTLVRATEQLADMHKDVAERAARIVQFACVLSDDVLASVGAERNQPIPSPGGVSVLEGKRLRTLCDAVRLSPQKLSELRFRAAVSQQDAERFCRGIGTVDEPDPNISYVYLTRTPLVRKGEDVVIVAPHLLAQAAVRAVLDLSRETECAERLSEAFHLVSLVMAEETLGLLGLRQFAPPRGSFTSPAGSIVSHILYQCDRDKAHHVMLASDALLGDLDGSWDTTPLVRELAASQEGVTTVIEKLCPQGTSWTTILVGSGIGRDYVVSLPVAGVPTWGMNAGDLEAIAYAEEERDSLLLWKFQEGLSEIRQTAEVRSWSPLDTYAAWRSMGRRFLRNDHPLATAISLAPDIGEVVRRDAARKRDWRSLNSWKPGRLVEVGLAEGPEVPIYLPRHSSTTQFCVAVETAGPLVWFVTPSTIDLTADPTVRITYAEIGRMLAFWCVEFSRVLTDSFEARRKGEPIVVEFQYFADGGPSSEEGYLVTKSGQQIAIDITHRLYENYDHTNTVERHLAAAVVAQVLDVAGVGDGASRVGAVLDLVAPVGPKRMLHAIRPDRNPVFQAAQGLPEERHVEEFDLYRARKIARGTDKPDGVLSGDDCHVWLNAAVGRLYEVLRAAVAGYDGSSLLGELMARNEALVLEGARRDLTLASVLACAEREPTLRDRIISQIARHASASSATRFLIEYVVAEPPRGDRQLSTATFDSWLAMAAEIVNLGAASDVVQYNLAKVSVRLAHSGYDVDLGGYEDAVVGGRERTHSERMDHERERAGVPGTEPVPQSPPPIPKELEGLSDGVLDEFGCRLDGLASIFREALALAQERQLPVICEPRNAFVSRLADRLGWDRPVTDQCVAHLMLEPRDAFVKPPAGYRTSDIWPWIFNRGLSYIRRPFVRRPDDTICFAPGQLSQAWTNLMMLFTTGRFRARTPRLRAAMDHYVQAPSRAFVEDVGTVLRARGLVARTHVEKIDGMRIEVERGRSLGDIDVLVAEKSKRRIVAIECKDLQLDRMPHEISSDLRDLFVGTPDKPAAQDRHLARVAWLAAHQDDVIRWLVGETTGRWRIESALVTRRALVSPYLGRAKLSIWTLRQLRRGEGP